MKDNIDDNAAKSQLIAGLRALLQIPVTTRSSRRDIDDIPQPTPIQQAYDARKTAYKAAREELERRRLAALSPSNTKEVQDWAENAHIYTTAVQATMSDWMSRGYKTEVEMIVACIAQMESEGEANSPRSPQVNRVHQINATRAICAK